MAKAPRHAPFWVKTRPRDRKTWNFIREMEKRRRALLRMVPYAVAVELHKGLMARIPNKADYKEYRLSLRVSEVMAGSEKRSAAFAVRSAIKSRKVKKIEVSKTVIYVRMNKAKMKPKDPAVKILEDYGPWTADTIPFWPEQGTAVVVQRRVTKRQADGVARQKKKEWPKVRRLLHDAGRKIPPKKKGPGQVKRNQKAIPDLAMLALSLEFGEGNRRATPAWRKTLNEIRQMIKKLPKRERNILNAWTDPNDKRWRNWPIVEDEVTESEARDYVGFQQRLGYG